MPRRDCCGARSIAQRERLHGDSQRAHRAIASGPSAHVFSAHAFDKALSQRHGSGSRRPRRLDPPVRDRASASLPRGRISCRSIAFGETATAGSCVLARIGIAYRRPTSGEPTPSKSGGLRWRSKRLAVTWALPEGPLRRARGSRSPAYRCARRATRYAEISMDPAAIRVRPSCVRMSLGSKTREACHV